MSKNPRLGVKKGESEPMRAMVYTLIVAVVFWSIMGLLCWRAL